MDKKEKIEFIKAWIEQNENAVKMGGKFIHNQHIEITKAEMRLTYLKKLLEDTKNE